MVGGRSYNQSQFNHVTAAHRQPGSVFKPFVFLAAFEQALADGRTDLSPAMIVADEPTTFLFDEKDYAPGNYDGEYEGPITLRHALARSRNIATIKVAEMIGFDKVADLWRRLGVGTPPQPYPSIALGVFEATPLEVATAYTIFTNGGQVRPVHSVQSLLINGDTVGAAAAHQGRAGRQARDHLPRHEHDAERARRRHRRVGALVGVQARGGRQVRHDQRPARRLVRRLHARAPDRGLGRHRRQHAARHDAGVRPPCRSGRPS